MYMYERMHVCVAHCVVLAHTLDCYGQTLLFILYYDCILDVRMGFETRFFRRETGGHYSRKVWSEFVVHIRLVWPHPLTFLWHVMVCRDPVK